LRNKEWEYIAAANALILCAIAAAIQVYPFNGRLLPFDVPGMILVMTRGAAWIIEGTRPRWRTAAQIVAGLAILWCLQSAVRASILNNRYTDEP